jgi:3-oxoacyl-[acyl-carrier-protein] synthase II
MARRVVITGMGWVTPLGTSLDGVWSRLLSGESAIGPITRFDASTFATNFGAEVRGFDLSEFIDDLSLHEGVGLSTGFALGAAAQAWKDAGLEGFAGLDRRRLGVYLGAGEGSLDYGGFLATHLASWDASSRRVDGARWWKEARERMSVVREIEQEPYLTVSHVAMEFGARGPSSNCMTACAASTQSVGEAAEVIKRGAADVMLAGGSHSMLHLLGMTGFIRLTAMSTRRETPETAARPFDRSRDGFVMGEGAGMLVLEDLEHAMVRGAEPLAELAGFGSSADAYRITDIHPDGRGAATCMRQALKQAGIDPREPREDGRPPVDYISAHGTGTQENDGIETTAVKSVFGSQSRRVMFSSVKSMLGHLIQAAGAVELITCVQAIRRGWAPPTINLNEPDPKCDLDYVPNVARDMRGEGGIEVCMSNGFGFGGQNNTVLVRRYRP